MGISWLYPWNWGKDIESLGNGFVSQGLQYLQFFLGLLTYMTEMMMYSVFVVLGLAIQMIANISIELGPFSVPVFLTLMVGMTLMLQVSFELFKDIPVVGDLA